MREPHDPDAPSFDVGIGAEKPIRRAERRPVRGVIVPFAVVCSQVMSSATGQGLRPHGA